MADTSNKKNIREESLRDLSDFLTAQGEKAFRAKQIWQWIWQRGVTDFAEMSNLSKATREMGDMEKARDMARQVIDQEPKVWSPAVEEMKTEMKQL